MERRKFNDEREAHLKEINKNAETVEPILGKHAKKIKPDLGIRIDSLIKALLDFAANKTNIQLEQFCGALKVFQ